MTELQQTFPLTLTYGSVSVPSTFDPSRRPIYIYPVTAMSRKNEDHARPLISAAVAKIIARHPNDRILIHTVTYALSHYLADALRNPRVVTYHSSSEKQRAIDRYLYTPSAILLAPSLDRGIDLPEDDCRAIIVCKVPFPNLGDKQISARIHTRGGQQWYTVRAIRSLVQMTGRGMRSTDDYCESYLLDKAFLDSIWRRNRNLLPHWWREALVWDRGTL